MAVETRTVSVKTRGICDMIDLTQEGARKVRECGIKNGLVTFFVSGSTAGLTTVEYEPGLIQDLKNLFQRLIPQGEHYRHDDTWGDANGFSHLRAALLKPSLTVPLVNGALTLGTWQQIVLIDFDNRPRNREIVLQIIGE